MENNVLSVVYNFIGLIMIGRVEVYKDINQKCCIDHIIKDVVPLNLINDINKCKIEWCWDTSGKQAEYHDELPYLLRHIARIQHQWFSIMNHLFRCLNSKAYQFLFDARFIHDNCISTSTLYFYFWFGFFFIFIVIILF